MKATLHHDSDDVTVDNVGYAEIQDGKQQFTSCIAVGSDKSEIRKDS